MLLHMGHTDVLLDRLREFGGEFGIRNIARMWEMYHSTGLLGGVEGGGGVHWS